jgi:hypothetical protein
VGKASRTQTSGNIDHFIKLLETKERRIDDLKAQQCEYAFLTPIFSSVPLEHLDFPSLLRNHDNLRSQLVNVSLRFSNVLGGEQRATLLASCNESQALSSLLELDAKSSQIACMRMEHLVQSLVAVAVRDWVFSEEFISPATTEAPLLQEYRRHLSTLCKFC